MSSWSQILQLSQPVVGNIEDYEFAERQISQLENSAENVRRQFKRIRTTELEELQGLSAVQLRDMVSDLDDCLNDLPLLLNDVGAIFRKHARELENIRARADEALARAETRWNDVQSAIADENLADNQLRSLRHQLNSLAQSAYSPEYIATRQADLTAAISTQERQVSYREALTSTAQQHLNSSRIEHGNLQGEEQALVAETVSALDNVDLRSLKNPEWYEQFGEWLLSGLGAIGEWLLEWVEDLYKTLEAAGRGDWGAAIWHLRAVLDKALTVVAVAGLIASVFFTGGATLALIGLTLGAMNLLTSAILYGTQAEHPETGERMSLEEVAFDAVAVVAGTAGVKAQGLLRQRMLADVAKKGVFDVNRAFKPAYKNIYRVLDPLGTGGAARASHLRRVGGELLMQTADRVVGGGAQLIQDPINDIVSMWLGDDNSMNYYPHQDRIDRTHASLEDYRQRGVSLIHDRARCELISR